MSEEDTMEPSEDQEVTGEQPVSSSDQGDDPGQDTPSSAETIWASKPEQTDTEDKASEPIRMTKKRKMAAEYLIANDPAYEGKGVDDFTSADLDKLTLTAKLLADRSREATKPRTGYDSRTDAEDSSSAKEAGKPDEEETDGESWLDEEAFYDPALMQKKIDDRVNALVEQRLSALNAAEEQKAKDKETAAVDQWFGQLSTNDYPMFGEGTIYDIDEDSPEWEARLALVQTAKLLQEKKGLPLEDALQRALMIEAPEEYQKVEARKAEQRRKRKHRGQPTPPTSQTSRDAPRSAEERAKDIWG